MKASFKLAPLTSTQGTPLGGKGSINKIMCLIVHYCAAILNLSHTHIRYSLSKDFFSISFIASDTCANKTLYNPNKQGSPNKTVLP
jgi:hypothetical protein